MMIRSERPGDAAAIEAVTLAAFKDAPHTTHTEQFIVRALREAGALSVSLVAEDAGVIVGHVALSPVILSGGEPGWYGLGPISVAPAVQGRGIGIRLMRAALGALRDMGAAGCVVLGDPAYYGRFGFVADPALVLPEVPPVYFQVLPLNGSVPVGTVSYHPAFAATA